MKDTVSLLAAGEKHMDQIEDRQLTLTEWAYDRKTKLSDGNECLCQIQSVHCSVEVVQISSLEKQGSGLNHTRFLFKVSATV